MAARAVPPGQDPIRPEEAQRLTINMDGVPVSGLTGQTIAGVLLGNGRLSWRRTAAGRRPRGVFCGIGVCFDCVVVVNGLRDVRACQQRARDRDEVSVQHDEWPTAAADCDGTIRRG